MSETPATYIPLAGEYGPDAHPADVANDWSRRVIAARADHLPERDTLTQGIAYARCPASLSRRLAELAEIAEIAARRPDIATPSGCLELVAGELRRLAAEAGAK